MLTKVKAIYSTFDHVLTERLSKFVFTQTLIQNPISKSITQAFIVLFVTVFFYEIFYWSGIRLGLWEYHARHIFKEIPVHCAHVFVRVNVAHDQEKLADYYQLKRESPYNILKWKLLNDKGLQVFDLKRFVQYHFEFSPEDFEMNPHPEMGSTIRHLRAKVLDTFMQSSVYLKLYQSKQISVQNVIIYNNRNEQVPTTKDDTYLSQIHIETGNLIDCIILI